MSPGAEPGLKHELDAQEQIADTSVSGTEGNAHLKEWDKGTAADT